MQCARPSPSSNYPPFTLQALDASAQVHRLGADERLEPRHSVRKPLVHVALQPPAGSQPKSARPKW